jgi:Ca2+-binding RTX toxin-like protein
MREGKTMRKHLTALGLAALTGTSVALWPASPASAQQGAMAYIVHRSEISPVTHLVYDGGPDEVNEVTVTHGANPNEFIIEDSGLWIEAFEGCTHPDPDEPDRVMCTIPAEELEDAYLYVDLGDENDTFTGSDLPEEVHAGVQDDTVHGEGGDDRIYGEDGDDVLHGGPGADEIDGGPGNDEIIQD